MYVKQLASFGVILANHFNVILSLSHVIKVPLVKVHVCVRNQHIRSPGDIISVRPLEHLTLPRRNIHKVQRKRYLSQTGWSRLHSQSNS
jgi:hypothetical protein